MSAERPGSAVPKPNARIATVDHDDQVLRLWSRIVTAAGFACVGAFATPEEALHQIPRLRPEVIVMEIRMPRISGIVCTRTLRQQISHVHVLIVSSATEADLIREAFAAGAEGYLLKDECESLIVPSITCILRGGTPVSNYVKKLLLCLPISPLPARSGNQLTRRQTDLSQLVALGYSDKMLADRTGLSLPTIRWHLREVFHRLGVHSRGEMVAKLFSVEQKYCHQF